MRVWVVVASIMGQPALAGDCMVFDAFALRLESSDVDMAEMDDGLTLIFNAEGRTPSQIVFTSTSALDDTGMSKVTVMQNGMTLHYMTEVGGAVAGRRRGCGVGSIVCHRLR
jgi:hypothetical protein